jgi:hypothetical protein
MVWCPYPEVEILRRLQSNRYYYLTGFVSRTSNHVGVLQCEGGTVPLVLDDPSPTVRYTILLTIQPTRSTQLLE